MGSIEIELGNARPKGLSQGHDGAPCVTYVSIPQSPPHDGHHGYRQAVDGKSGRDVVDHIADAIMFRGGVTNLAGHEPVLAIVHPAGIWQAHAEDGTKPTWVHAVAAGGADQDEADEVERILADLYGCPRGRPDDLEDTHHTMAGAPGVHPVEPTGDVEMQANITQNGRDIQSRDFGAGKLGVTGKTTTAPTATGITLTGQSAPGSTTAWNGQVVVAGTATAAWGRIQSNTTAAPPVLTIDRWYNPATPGGAAATTPANTSVYVIVNAAGPCQWVGLSTLSTYNPAAPATTTSLPTEIVTATGGLVRQFAPYAHTASATTTTLTPVYTANTHDTLPATVYGIGVFNSAVHTATTQTMFFGTKLSASATLSASGDQLTVTETITGS